MGRSWRCPLNRGFTVLRSTNAKYHYFYFFFIKWIKETYLWCVPVFFGVNSLIYSQVFWLLLFDPCHSLHNMRLRELGMPMVSIKSYLPSRQENSFVEDDWTRLFSSPPDSFHIWNILLRLKQHKIIIVTNLQCNYRKTEKIRSAVILPQIDKIPAFSSTDIIHWAADFFSSAMFVMFEQVRKKCHTKYLLSLFLFVNVLLIVLFFFLASSGLP